MRPSRTIQDHPGPLGGYPLGLLLSLFLPKPQTAPYCSCYDGDDVVVVVEEGRCRAVIVAGYQDGIALRVGDVDDLILTTFRQPKSGGLTPPRAGSIPTFGTGFCHWKR